VQRRTSLTFVGIVADATRFLVAEIAADMLPGDFSTADFVPVAAGGAIAPRAPSATILSKTR
jgi:hypothetical protein